MTESDARDAGWDVVVAVKQLPATFAGVVHPMEGGTIKVGPDQESGALIGAAVTGPQGGDGLGMLTLAVDVGAPLVKLQSMLYGFPALYSAPGGGPG